MPEGPDRLAGFAPEDRLLLECSRAEIDAAGAERVASLVSGPVDWDAVLEASIRHGVAPLLKRGLDQVGGLQGRVPQDVIEALVALHENSARRNHRLFEALVDVVGAMRAASVDPVGLKDVQLAAEIYPEPALRPMGDIDLLIRRKDWDAAARCLAGLGFLPRPSADVPYTLIYASAQHFRRAGDEIWIDLQWNVMQREWDLYGEGRFTYDGLGMWTRAVPMALDGYELRVPSLEDMLFHLCLHLEGHMYSELVLFCDIAELLQKRGAELKWDTLLEITRSYRAESSVYYVLLLTERLLGAPVPVEVLEQLEPPYFHGGLLAPIFANLTPLHLSLDEIRLSVAPPQPLMDELERIVRRQTARALRLDAEVDMLATTFLDRGGKLFVVDGAPSQRLFPDPSLPAFEPLHAYVLERDASLLGERLAAAQLTIATSDPVLASEQPNLTLVCERSSDARAVPSSGEQEGLTNARSALRSLRHHLSRSGGDDREAVAHLVIHALAADELIVTLAAKVGSAHEDRLFQLCGLLDALRTLHGMFDAGRIAELAARYGVQEVVSAGLFIAGALADDVPAPPLARERITPPRLLQWARYGPSSLKRYPWLRSAYYFAFALLATPGARPKLRYFLRSLGDGTTNGGPAALPMVARGIIAGILRSRGASTPSGQQLAHWLEPETAALLERRLERSVPAPRRRRRNL